MNIGLIDCELKDENLPLGLLSIAPVMQNAGHHVELFRMSDPRLRSGETTSVVLHFAKNLAARVLDLVGISARSDNLVIGLDTARHLKQARPDLPVVLGGPGATFVDREIIEAFPQVDFIVRGEGEVTFAELVSVLEAGGDLSSVQGLSLRSPTGEAIRTANRPPLQSIDDLPAPAYDLIDETLRRHRTVDIVLGRGCPNNCVFCSTRAFWGSHVRMRSPEKVVREMQTLHTTYGIRRFKLVHDNALSAPLFLKDFCRLKRRLLPKSATFSISGSLNFINKPLLKTLWKAGCRGLYVGVESASLKENLSSKFLGPHDVLRKLRLCKKIGLRLTKSHIIGFANETTADIDATLSLAAEGHARLGRGDYLQIHPLTICPGTKLYQETRHCLTFTDLLGDFAEPLIFQNDYCLAMCRKYPHIFTAYASWTDSDSRRQMLERVNFYKSVLQFFPKSTIIAWRQLKLAPTALLDCLKECARKYNHPLPDMSCCTFLVDDGSIQKIYETARKFPFLIRACYQESAVSLHFIECFLNAERAVLQSFCGERSPLLSPSDVEKELSSNNHIPLLPATTNLADFRFNVSKTFERFLRHGTETIHFMRSPRKIIYYVPRYSAMSIRRTEHHRSLLLCRHMQDIVSHVLDLVDGRNSFAAIADEVSHCYGSPFICKVVRKLLVQFTQMGILVLSHEKTGAGKSLAYGAEGEVGVA